MSEVLSTLPKVSSEMDLYDRQGMLMSRELQIMMKEVLGLLSQNGCTQHLSNTAEDRFTELFKGTSMMGYSYEVKIEGSLQGEKVSVDAGGLVSGESLFIGSQHIFHSQVIKVLREFFYDVSQEGQERTK